MPKALCLEKFSLPKDWPEMVKSSIMYIISLTYMAMIYVHNVAANSLNACIRLQAKLERARNETLLLKEEIRIKDQRMKRIRPKHRPYYTPFERMAILELKAARGWSSVQTAKALLLQPQTICSWSRRIDEQGPKALLRVSEPINKFPDFVRYNEFCKMSNEFCKMSNVRRNNRIGKEFRVYAKRLDNEKVVLMEFEAQKPILDGALPIALS